MILGSQAQRQQLAENGFLNIAFIAYYKDARRPNHPIALHRLYGTNEEPPHYTHLKRHTVLTYLLRFNTNDFDNQNLLHDLLALRNTEAAARVDLEQCFVHEEGSIYSFPISHFLLSFLLELIVNQESHADAVARQTLLGDLLLNRNNTYGRFTHKPDAICYRSTSRYLDYELNFAAFMRLKEQYAHVYNYLFLFDEPGYVVTNLSDHEHQYFDDFCLALPGPKEHLIFYAGFWELINLIDLGRHDVVPELRDAIVDFFPTPTAQPIGHGFPLRVHQTNKRWLSQAIGPNIYSDALFKLTAEHSTVLTIQSWRYHLATNEPFYLHYLQLSPADKFALVIRFNGPLPKMLIPEWIRFIAVNNEPLTWNVLMDVTKGLSSDKPLVQNSIKSISYA